MTVILIFIILLNIVSIVLMYYCLADTGKKEKLIFIAAGTAIMYILTTIVYWISTNGIEMNEVSEMGRDLIVFLFVPINGILVLPIFAKSYYKYTMGSLKSEILRNRGIALLILLIIVLIIECVYFKNIQQQVVNLILERQNNVQEESAFNEIRNDDIENSNTITDATDITGGTGKENGNTVTQIIGNTVANDIDSNQGTNEVMEVSNNINENVSSQNNNVVVDN